MMENNSRKQKAPLVYAIVGVMTLIIAVAGSTYAFYAASVQDTTNVTGTAGGGAAPTMTVTKVSTDATGNLIPIDMDQTTLSKAASATKKCVDNNGYSACQIYSVTVTNNANTAQTFDISLTALSGTSTPNIEAVTMGTSNSAVASATSIKGVNKGICTTNSVAAGGTSNTCYFMVFIKNLDTAQTDNGTFNGTVTAVSSTGAQTKADFS